MKLFLRNFRYWLPAALWLVVISLESAYLASSVTGGWLWQIFRALHVPISVETFNRLHHVLRKGGHVTGYGILCLLLFRAWYHSLRSTTDGLSIPHAISRSRLRCAGLALGMTLTAAILDEWHQSFDPRRTSSVRDVGLDITGGIIFLCLALFVFKLWREMPLNEAETAST